MNDPELAERIRRKCRESAQTTEQTVARFSEDLVRCARALAAVFDGGGKLFTLGNGGSACDALHVAVEFVHPIVEKRPPLAAMALCSDVALLTAVGNDQDFGLVFSKQLKLLARPGDAVLGMSTSGKSSNVNRALKLAREMKLLTIGLSGRDGGALIELCDHAFVVPSYSIHRIQETHVLLLHVLWDMVHVVRGEEDVI